jgi:hypothetical protein
MDDPICQHLKLRSPLIESVDLETECYRSQPVAGRDETEETYRCIANPI